MTETTRKEAHATRPKTLRTLTRVLSYEDLLEDKSVSLALDAISARARLGRARDNDALMRWLEPEHTIAIADPWMSSAHAELSTHDGAFTLRDTGSSNGTWVNGERITERALVDGDVIELGHTLLCYREVLSTIAARAASAGSLAFGPTKTHCPEVRAMLADLAKIAPSAVSVLILAETGAGKEVLASLVHAMSGRAGRFVAVDGGAVPDSLLESTFFGHRKGAFSGAQDAREGLVRRADRGTLFLDEAGNLSPEAQAALLRAIETGTVMAVGGDRPESVDVRWVAATHRPLFEDASFREDLLRRLAGYVAKIPPLRARREDLGALCAHVLREANVHSASITVEAARALFTSDFPGNVRQLRAALRSAVLLSAGEPIAIEHLPEDLRAPRRTRSAPPSESPAKLDPPALERLAARPSATPSREELTAVLVATRGNVVRAAEQLATHPRQIYRWIEREGLDLERIRDGKA